MDKPDEEAWELINRFWASDPNKRPTCEDVLRKSIQSHWTWSGCAVPVRTWKMMGYYDRFTNFAICVRIQMRRLTLTK
jgi:hypothetical protein